MNRKLIHSSIIMLILFTISLFFFTAFNSVIRFYYSTVYSFQDLYNYIFSIFSKRNFNYDRIYNYVYNLKESPGSIPLPAIAGNFWTQLKVFFKLVINKYNFQLQTLGFVKGLILFTQLFYLIILLFFVLRQLFNNQFALNDLQFTDKSKSLKRAEKINEKIIRPFIDYIKSIYFTIIDTKFYKWFFVISYALLFNVLALILDTFGFLFYFASTFKLISIYEYIYVVLFTLWPVLSKIPLPIYLLITFLILKRIQKNIAIQRLYHMDSMNKGFAKSLGVVTNVVAPPRAGKTTTLVALGQDFEEIFRNEFLNILETYSAYFPKFPWCEFEREIIRLRDNGYLLNRYVIKDYVAFLFYEYKENGCFKFNYDLENDITHIDLGNKLIFLEAAMITYGEAYYYYNYEGSLISSNFSNRADFYRIQHGNKFPLFVFPALTISAMDSYQLTHYSKNINFDSFRVFKKVKNETPPLTDIGIYLEMESSKQWGNQYDNKEFKKNDEFANPLNDGFSFFLSSFAHASLIDYQPFIRYIMDYQRVGDLAVKFAGMSETRVTIVPNEEPIRMALPFYILTPMFYESLISLRKKIYTRRYRAFRDDQTLFFNTINRLGSWATRKLMTDTNNYGFNVNNLVLTSGNDDAGRQEFRPKRYYIFYKKHYSDRFKSDALKAMYEDSLRPGFLYFESFGGLEMSSEDLIKQNSYAVLNRFSAEQNLTQNNEAPVGLFHESEMQNGSP